MSTDQSIRDEIFRLRSQDPPVSIRKIAAELSISPARVQRELAARATRGGGSSDSDSAVGMAIAAANGHSSSSSIPTMHGASGSVPAYDAPGIDPEIATRRRNIERRRLALQEQELEARELETANRVELLRRSARGDSGGDARFAELLINEIHDLRSRIDRPAAPPPSIVTQLSEMQQVSNAVAALAPPRAPTSALDLEFNLASMRVTEESQRLIRKQEAEMAIEKAKVEGDAARNHAMAKVIEDFGPAVMTAAVKWLENQNKPPAAAVRTVPASLEDGAGESAPTLAGPPAAKGFCPRCGAGELEIVPTGTDQDTCPACGLVLRVEAGQIVSGEYSLPAPEVARYAS